MFSPRLTGFSLPTVSVAIAANAIQREVIARDECRILDLAHVTDSGCAADLEPGATVSTHVGDNVLLRLYVVIDFDSAVARLTVQSEFEWTVAGL